MAKRSPEKRTQQVVTSGSAEVIDLGSHQAEKEEIARLAYEFWLERGSPIGTAEEDWFRAEAEVRSRRAGPFAELFVRVERMSEIGPERPLLR
jgi:DUF2934 family protein